MPGRSGPSAALRTIARRPGGRRLATLALPLVVALATLGFEHAEPGVLRSPPVMSGLARATASEVALRGAILERAAAIRRRAAAYGIEWELAAGIHDAAVNAGLDVDLAYRLVRVESSFRQGAIGPAGSIGFTQVQPNTARWLDPSISREDLFEVETNLRLGFAYLRMLIERYRDTRLALLAYNRGPGTVAAVLAAGEDPSNGYAERVLGGGTR